MRRLKHASTAFDGFLMFCTVYLLLDSLLCFSDSEPVYTALFLIGGCVILVSVLILYLWYIKELLRNRRLKDENVQLEAELVFHDQKTGTLRQMTDRDTMTGAYSRKVWHQTAGTVFTPVR